MTEQIKNGTIARLEVTRGSLTEYPLAERVRGGWQNGVAFYSDADVTKVSERYARVQETGADEARRFLALASVRPSMDWPEQTGETKADVIGEAQVHATLALVEQQRIANLIALSAWQELGPNDGKIRIPSFAPDGTLRDDIREGLGL